MDGLIGRALIVLPCSRVEPPEPAVSKARLRNQRKQKEEEEKAKEDELAAAQETNAHQIIT